MSDIKPVGMPKWGLSMKQGLLNDWLVEEGAHVDVGEDIAEVETEKINGVVEAPAAGVVRRRVASAGAMVPVGGLLAVLADADVPDEEIDRWVADFQARFDATAAAAEAEEAGPETAEAGGRRIRFLERGGQAGDPVILLHGFGGDLNNWLFTLPALAEAHRVIAVDLPGHGGSVKDVGSGQLDDLVDALAAFLDARGLAAVHLVGHSLGGLVAMGLALRDRTRVRSLTLVASAGFGPEIDRAYLDGFIRASGRKDLKPVLQRLFADPDQVTRQMVDDVLKYKRLDGVDAALRAVRDALFPEDGQRHVLLDDVAKLDLPLLVVWGAQDAVVPAAHARKAPPTAQVHVLDGAGHSPHMEAAGEVNRLLLDFLGRH